MKRWPPFPSRGSRDPTALPCFPPRVYRSAAPHRAGKTELAANSSFLLARWFFTTNLKPNSLTFLLPWRFCNSCSYGENKNTFQLSSFKMRKRFALWEVPLQGKTSPCLLSQKNNPGKHPYAHPRHLGLILLVFPSRHLPPYSSISKRHPSGAQTGFTEGRETNGPGISQPLRKTQQTRLCGEQHVRS